MGTSGQDRVRYESSMRYFKTRYKYFITIHGWRVRPALRWLVLVRNLGKAAPNSSQRSGLVEANCAAVPDNREKWRTSIQHLQDIGQRRWLAISGHGSSMHTRTSTSLKPCLADCVAAGAAVEAARLTAGTMV